MKKEHILIFITTSSQEEASKIARALVEQQLAACVGILNQSSIYRWKGEIVEEDERLLTVKTVKEQFKAVRTTVLGLHSYEVPEIISVEISEGHGAYLAWITECVSQ